MMLQLRYLIPVLAAILLLLPGCSGPKTVTEVISPARTARECSGPSPQIVAAWRADLMKSGISAIPMPKPVCVDVEISEETVTRPTTWGERLGWSLETPPSTSYHHPGCGLASTDQQTGVIFCARDNDRDEGRDTPRSGGCDGDCRGDIEPPPSAPVDPPTPNPGMMGPGD